MPCGGDGGGDGCDGGGGDGSSGCGDDGGGENCGGVVVMIVMRVIVGVENGDCGDGGFDSDGCCCEDSFIDLGVSLLRPPSS